MYVTAYINLQRIDGEEACYEVGAEVELDPGGYGWKDSYGVGEPEVSAANQDLSESRVYPDPQCGETFAAGWSDTVEEALIEAYQASARSRADEGLDPDEFRDPYDDIDDYHTKGEEY